MTPQIRGAKENRRATENNQAEEHFEDNLVTAAIKEEAFKKAP